MRLKFKGFTAPGLFFPVSFTAGASCYFKYFLSVVMEAVTMALAILICNAFISAGLPSFTGGYVDWAQVLIYLCEITFTIALTVGACKGAQSLTGRAVGHCRNKNRTGQWAQQWELPHSS